MQLPPTRVVLSRGDLAESEHQVRVAVWKDGRIVHAAGDVDRPVYLRSSAKPLQALASVVTGAADRFAMTDAELSLACGSHGGEPFHVETAAGLLNRIGLGPEHLLCGAHPPSYDPAARDLLVRGEKPTNLHNNCSGKHSNMLAACVAMGWPVEEYVAFDHPLQRLNVEHVAAFAGIRPREVTLGIDGCSAPNFAVPLTASARAFALWATPSRATGIPDAARDAATRIRAAVAARPEMIGGTKRVDSDLVRVTGGRVIAKMGAEGVWCLAVTGAEIGIAIKAEDGSSRGAYPVGLAVLRTLGVISDADWDQLVQYHDPLLRNHRRLVVGRVDVIPPTGV